MKLVFRGHDDRYAVEQSLLAFFPEERPVYQAPEPGEDNWARVDLHQGPVYATAVTEIAHGGRLGRGMSRRCCGAWTTNMSGSACGRRP